MLLVLKNCMNVFPHPQELYNKHMVMRPTRIDCITYTVSCILQQPHSNGLEMVFSTLVCNITAWGFLSQAGKLMGGWLAH